MRLHPGEARLAPIPVARSGRPMDVIAGPVLRLLVMVIDLYIWVVVIGVVFSWLSAFNIINTSNRFAHMVGEFVYRATEPPLRQIRRIMPNLGNFDISPIILIFALIFAKDILIRVFVKFG